MTAAKAESELPEPRANPDLFGHEAAEARLYEAWRSGRLPHAWLITGPEGVGKATLAFRFARFVLTQGSGEESGAGEGGLFGPEEAAPGQGLAVAADSPVFRRVAAGSHADLATLRRGWDEERKRWRTVITVDEVRAATAAIGLTSGEGGRRVLVVDTADELNDNAANALLKMLEEPPPNALILLISHSPGRLRPTIRSRCCRLALGPLSSETVAALLRRARPTLDAEEAAALAGLADGSIGRALRLAESDGLDLFQTLLGLLGALPRVDAVRLEALAARLSRRESEAAYRTAMDLLFWWLARMVRTGTGTGTGTGAAAPREIVAGEAGSARRMAGLAGLDRWAEVWENSAALVERAERLNLDRGQVVHSVFRALQRAASG